MDLQDLALFRSIVECGSMTRAAEAYSMTQPTVSRHLQRLEQEVGFPLIDRGGAPLLPTPEGRHFLEFADQVLAGWTDLQERLGRPDTISGDLRIGVTTSYAAGAAVSRWMGRFVAKYQGVRPRLVTLDSRGVEEAALQHRVVVGFMSCAPQNCCLESVPVERDDLVLITPAGGVWRDLPDPVSPERILELPFVRREHGSGTWDTVERALAEAGLSPRLKIVMEADSVEAVLGAVTAGVGASFVSAAALKNRDTSMLRTLSVERVELRHQVYLVYDPIVLMRDPLAALFCRFMEQAAASHEMDRREAVALPRRIG